MNGPRHYEEAEACMTLSVQFHNKGAVAAAGALMARAQVHAALALVAATIDQPRNAPELTQEFADWRSVLAVEAPSDAGRSDD